MANDRQMMNDMARLASGAAGTLFGMRDELEARGRAQLERVVARMDLVKREEFEAVRLMAEQARAENEALKVKLADLEAKLSS